MDCINSVVDQRTEEEYEIIVVDDGSTDDTEVKVRSLIASHGGGNRVRYLKRSPSGLNASRNAGFRESEASVLAFLDDDVLASDSYVDAVLGGVEMHPDVDCFAGRIRLRLEGRPPRWCGREPLGETELEQGDEDRFVENAWGANLIVRRRALEEVGLFAEAMDLYGDEVEWQSRIKGRGGRILYLAGADVWHRRTGPELTLRALLRRNFRKGLSYPQTRILMQEHVSPLGGLRQVVVGLGHAVRFGCAIGVVRAALGIGHTLAAMRLLFAGHKSPYLHWAPARRQS